MQNVSEHDMPKSSDQTRWGAMINFPKISTQEFWIWHAYVAICICLSDTQTSVHKEIAYRLSNTFRADNINQ